jgi:hypothetical protein
MASGVEMITCIGCGAMWEYTFLDSTEAERGEFTCNCGAQIHKWDGTRRFFEFCLTRSALNDMEEHQNKMRSLHRELRMTAAAGRR